MKHMPEFTTHHAKITVQTQDALTGKIIDQVHGENFSANQVIRQAKWQQRNAFKTGITTIGATDTDYAPHQATQALVLTDSGLAEDSTNEWQMPGNLLGYALKSTYAGSDIYRGTPNITQLAADSTSTKWVFDWPTNAANGTIRSVGWVGYQAQDSTTSTGPFFYTSATIEQSWSASNIMNYFARASNTLSFSNSTSSPTSVAVLDTTYAQTTTFSVSSQFTSITGLAWDSGNNFLWVIGANNSTRRIAAYNSSGVLQTGPYTTTTRTYNCLAFDGTYLWSTTQISGINNTAWKISTSDGSDVSNFDFTTSYWQNNTSYPVTVCGLCWDPTYARLWVRTAPAVSGYNSFIASYNTSGVKQTPDISTYVYTPSAGNFSVTISVYAAGTNSRDFDVIDGNQFAVPNNYYGTQLVYRLRADNLGTRSLLSSPVVKANTQTLKVIYTINYV
jgi:hypothetical protein